MWRWPSTLPTTSRRASATGGWGGNWHPRAWSPRRSERIEGGRSRGRVGTAGRAGTGPASAGRARPVLLDPQFFGRDGPEDLLDAGLAAGDLEQGGAAEVEEAGLRG